MLISTFDKLNIQSDTDKLNKIFSYIFFFFPSFAIIIISTKFNTDMKTPSDNSADLFHWLSPHPFFITICELVNLFIIAENEAKILIL